MYHSITIGDKNTWDDWHLIPKSRPVINPPPVKTHFVDVPGGDGILDLSTALTGRTLFGNRTGSLEFYVENGFRDWSIMYSEVMRCIHGKKLKAILEDDPAYYYEGRFSVSEWRSEAQRSTIVIDYDLFPYKKEVHATDEDWIWDTFNFETGVIRNYRNLTVSGTLDVILTGYEWPSVPVITTSANGMSVDFGGKNYPLTAGNNVISGIIIQNGENTLKFHGSGTITIKYTGGRL